MGFNDLPPLHGNEPPPLLGPLREISGTGIKFSHDMPAEQVSKCINHYRQLSPELQERIIELHRNEVNSEGRQALTRSLYPSVAAFSGNAASYATSVSGYMRPKYEESYRLAQELKPSLEAIARFKGTPGAREKAAAAIRDLRPKLLEFNDSINKTTDVLYSQKLAGYSALLMNKNAAANMARKGILIENLDDFNTLLNGCKATRALGNAGIGLMLYNNYSEAIDNIANGANEQRQLFIANSKTTFEWIGGYGGAEAATAIAILIAPETGGLSLIVLAVAGAAIGTGMGEGFSGLINKIYDLF